MIKAPKLLGYMRAAAAEILARGRINGDKPLRKTQLEALEAYAAFLDRSDLKNQEKLSGFFEIPTGVGKTALFGAMIDSARRHADADGVDLRVGIVSPTISLLRQTADEIAGQFPALAPHIGLYGGKDRQSDKPLTIITYDSWANLVDRGQLGPHSFDLLISDEGHRGTSAAREKRLADRFEGIGRLAFTATAHFDPHKTVYNTHKHKIYEKHIAEAVKDGELASYIQVQYHIIRIDPIIDGRKGRYAQQAAFNQFAEHILLTGVDERSGSRLTDNQGGIFVQSTAQADHLADSLNRNPRLQAVAQAQGCKAFATAIHTQGMSETEQNQREKDYKAGLYLYVIGDEKFKEGFNHPPMKTVIDAPHGSLVDKAQILGRGARRYYNPAKNRSEGLTFVDTIIYVGSHDPVIDQRERSAAIASAIAAIEVLDDQAVIAKAGATSTQAQPAPQSRYPRHGNPLQGIQVASYVTLKEIRTFLTERTRLRSRSDKVDLENPVNRKQLDELLERKNHPGSERIFNSLPPTAKERDAEGRILFGTHQIIRLAIKGRQRYLRQDQWVVLLKTIESMEGSVDLTHRDNQKTLQDLLAKKGNPKGTALLKALPCEAKIPDAAGRVLFRSESSFDDILAGRQKSLRTAQWQALLTTLHAMPDRECEAFIDPTTPFNQKKLKDLRARKGNPSGKTIFESLPLDATTPDASGRVLFGSATPILLVIAGQQKSLRQAQWDTIITTLEGFEDSIDLTDASNQKKLSDLHTQKGNPGGKKIFDALDKKSQILFGTPRTISDIISGKRKSLPQTLWEVLLETLGNMPDRRAEPLVDITTPSNRRRIDDLLHQKGNPGSVRIYATLPSESAALFASHATIHAVLKRAQQTLRESQWVALLSALEKMPDKKAEPVIDLTDPANHKTLNDLLVRKGYPGSMRVFNALPEEAKTSAAGDGLGNSNSTIENTLYGRQKSLRRSQWKILLATLRKMPDAQTRRVRPKRLRGSQSLVRARPS